MKDFSDLAETIVNSLSQRELLMPGRKTDAMNAVRSALILSFRAPAPKPPTQTDIRVNRIQQATQGAIRKAFNVPAFVGR